MHIFRAMGRHQDDAQVLLELEACGALRNLAGNNASQVTLVAAGVLVRIIQAMDRHQDDAQLSERVVYDSTQSDGVFPNRDRIRFVRRAREQRTRL